MIIGLLWLLPTFSTVNALYVITLPSNTIYADDFESYGSTSCSANTSTADLTDQGVLTSCLGGWAYLDNQCGATGMRALNTTYAFSPSHSLSLQMNKVSAKCDVDRRGNAMNSTKIVQLSVHFAFSNNMLSTNNIAGAGDGLHIALEYWDKTTHWEAVTFFIAKSAGAQPDLVFDGTPGVTQGTDNLMTPFIKPYDIPTADSRLGYWHQETVAINLVNHQWVSAEIDGYSYTYLVAGHNLRSINDATWAGQSPPFHYRLEFAVTGPTTFAASTDRFFAWFDDVQLTDITPGQPNVIQFGLVGYSAWIPLIMAMAGVNTTLSTWSLVIRLLKKNDGSALRGLLVAHTRMIVGMNIAVVAFLIVLVLGSIYLPGTCPAGAVCNG